MDLFNKMYPNARIRHEANEKHKIKIRKIRKQLVDAKTALNTRTFEWYVTAI